MTIAALVVPRDREEALADAAGRASVRRIVDVAWAGGALPIVVVVDDADGSVAAALAGSPAIVAGPGDGAYRAGADAAVDAVVGTDGWLLWPGDRTWVDPETVTSLIEAHGARPDAVLRPGHEDRIGWPILIPATRSDLLDRPDPVPPDAIRLDLGDPGTVATRGVALDDLPGYVGPAAPVSGPPPDWGAAAAEEPDWEATSGVGSADEG